MSSLLPSDMGRLIYGHLRAECSERLAEEFLDTCDSMKECRRQKQIGFNSKIYDRTLTQMLNEYSVLSDLIFEQSNENDRSHFNIVDTLQNLLKSRLPFSNITSQKDVTVTHLQEGTQEISLQSKKSEHILELSMSTQSSLVEDIKIHDTLNKNQENDLGSTVLSSSNCSESSPANNLLVKNTVASLTSTEDIRTNVQPNQETLIVNNASVTAVTSTPIPVNEDQRLKSPRTLNPSSVILSEFPSLCKNTGVFGIAKTIPTYASVLTTNHVFSEMKLASKIEEKCNATTSNTVVSPKSPCEIRKIDNVDTFPKNVPVQSDIAEKQKSSDRQDVCTKISSEELPTNESAKNLDSVLRPINDNESILPKTPMKTPSKSCKEVAKIISSTDVSLIQNTTSESHTTISRISNPVKILPKLPSSISKPFKNDVLTSKIENNVQNARSCAKLNKPVPWDYGLRQAIIDDVDSKVDSNRISVKHKKNRTPMKKKNNDIPLENIKIETTINANKRKHEKRPTVCKKQKKMEEARKLIEMKKEKATKKNSGELKQVGEKVMEISKKSKNIVCESLKSNDSASDDDEDIPVRREIDDEIVLFYKVSTDCKV